MFDHENLVRVISSGKIRILLNGEERFLSGPEGTVTPEGLRWRIEKENKGRFTEFSLTLTNEGPKKMEIGDITLFSYGEDGVHGELSQRIIYDFRNALGDNHVVPVTEFSGNFDDCPMFLVTDGQRTLLAAQLSFHANEFHFRSRFASDGTLEEVRCELASPPCPLPPGKTFTTDALAVYSCGENDPLDLLFAWAEDVRKIHNPDLPSKTWGGFGPGTLIHDPMLSTEQKILDQIENAGNLPRLGVKYFWISIANIEGLLPGNWLYPNEKKFPGGLRNILEKIKAAGLVPGFWLNPFAMAKNSRDYAKMEPYLIRKKDGSPASRGVWHHAEPDENGRLPELFALDPSCPEVFDYIRNVLETYASWGIRYYMIDFLETGRYRKDERSSGYALENYLRFIRKLREYAPKDTHFLSATGGGVAHIGAFSSSRIGMDYCEGRALFKHWPSYPADYVIGGSLGSSGSPRKNAVNNMAMWAFADRTFFRCNSNMMTVDKPIPLNEARITATLYGISSSPVFFGDSFKFVDAERLALIKKVLPRGENFPLPVDLFTKTDLEKDFVRVFRTEIRKAWGTYYLCAVFNLNERVRTLTLSDSFLRIPGKRAYCAYDFWEEEYLGTFENEFTLDVPGNSAKVIRLEEKKEHPWLLSTDFTVRQGDSEIESLRWDEASLTLSGRAYRAPGEEGNLFFLAPDGFKVKDFNRGFRVMKTARDMSLVIKKHLFFSSDTEEFRICFERWEGTDPKYKVDL